MPGDVDIAHRLARRVWRAAQLRRAGLWIAGAVPWLVLRNAPGLLAWSAFCAWDGLRLQRQVAHGWPAWIDDAVPEMEDSSALLLDDPATQSPIARLQRQRLLARLEGLLDRPRLRAIARAHVTPGWPWLAADQPPEVNIAQPTEMTHDLARDATSARIAVSVRDDYRIQQATMHLTLARGSGENIKFSDRELPLPASPDPRKRDWAKDWALPELGMQPGDELYFFVRASDNAARPHIVQSATYTLRLPAPAAT